MSHQRNTSQNHNELPLHAQQDGCNKKTDANRCRWRRRDWTIHTLPVRQQTGKANQKSSLQFLKNVLTIQSSNFTRGRYARRRSNITFVQKNRTQTFAAAFFTVASSGNNANVHPLLNGKQTRHATERRSPGQRKEKERCQAPRQRWTDDPWPQDAGERGLWHQPTRCRLPDTCSSGADPWRQKADRGTDPGLEEGQEGQEWDDG